MKYTDDCYNHYERSLSAEMVVIMLMVMMIIPMLRKAVGGPGSPPHYKCHITAMCIVFIKTTINMGMMTMDVLPPHQISNFLIDLTVWLFSMKICHAPFGVFFLYKQILFKGVCERICQLGNLIHAQCALFMCVCF